MSAFDEIVKHIRGTTFEDIPKETIERQKDFLIDTLGVALASLKAPGVREVIDLLKGMGGKKESTILIDGGKVPSFHAAMANSLMAHSLDFDDMHEKAGIHANVCVIPAALAMAERVGGVDGKALLTALVLGVDLVCRMGLSIPLSRGWHATTTFGIFGTTVSSSKILGLDEKKMGNALGIAYCQSSGNRQGRLEGALTKRLQPALASKDGVFSSILASEGITGPKEILEGEWGMLRLYGDPHYSEDREKIIESLMKGLGRNFLGDELSIKPYPSCKATHASIDAVLNILKENQITPEQVEEVEISVSKGCYGTAGRPFEIRTNPQVDAQFSIPYTVTTAILQGKVGLEDFTEPAIREARRLEMAKRVKVSVDPNLQEPSTNVVNLESQVVLRAEGKTYSHRSSISKGHPDRPMDREEVLTKFESCLQFGTSFPPEKGRKIFSTILNLEKIEDIRSMITLLC
ncbi:MAG: MmgE/PrpD family protein [Thermodesulfobacteriota bacterium]|nr:MmgE/PrpD family protein [Thermodesulfobacteriota bacterium]